MVKKIYYHSVFLHNYIKNLLENPPKGYEFIVNINNKKRELIDKLKENRIANFLYKRIIKRFFSVWELMRETKVASQKADLIFSTDSIIEENKPWIIKILDNPYSMAGNNYELFMKRRRAIEKALESENCKSIIVHTEASIKLFAKHFNDKVTSKVVLVTPAIPMSIKKKTKRKSKEFTILFMGSTNNPEAFYQKGGLEALEAMRELSKNHDNIKLIMRCKIPEIIAGEYGKMKNVEFIERRLSDEELSELYNNTDVLLSPGYNYFIMVYLEAFSYGIPIIALDTYGVDEFVIDGVNGFTVKPTKMLPLNNPEFITEIASDKYLKIIKKKDPEVAKNLSTKISKLIDNPELLKRFGAECRKRLLRDYSFKKKLAKLKKIFDAATAR